MIFTITCFFEPKNNGSELSYRSSIKIRVLNLFFSREKRAGIFLKNSSSQINMHLR